MHYTCHIYNVIYIVIYIANIHSHIIQYSCKYIYMHILAYHCGRQVPGDEQFNWMKWRKR